MENKYFDIKDTLYELTNKYEEAIDLLVSVGFDNMKDGKQRNTIGKAITLDMALKMKKVNVETFTKQLIDIIESNKNQLSELLEDTKEKKDANVNIKGVLPCPVRVPLMESLKEWLNENEEKLDISVDYELKAASVGVDWIKESLEKSDNPDVLSDIFISAGFDLFFDKHLIGKYKNENIFEDITSIDHYNKDFDNDYISLKDPDNEYSMIGVVPAVFLINTNELDGRELPTTWEELLTEEYENKVSLPIGDFDLFNAILLNVYKKYGEEGIKKLGRSLLTSMHPSEMVKSHIKDIERPIVTIMPYFFTKMTKRGGPMEAVWPKDGAILSPIFLLSKKDKNEKLKPIVDFFSSIEVGEILSHNGKFPSVNPNVDNRVNKEDKYMWLGWDFIKENDIGELISKCEKIFNDSIKGV
jgi:ABC-type Fe3+ transport system substrate-binding protein